MNFDVPRSYVFFRVFMGVAVLSIATIGLIFAAPALASLFVGS